MKFAASLLLAALVAALVHADGKSNMNGVYSIGNPDTTSKTKYSTDYTRRGESVEFFDVYSPPIQTRYGEVYWTMMDPVAIPSEIQNKFKNSTIAIVGYEVDQVKQAKNGTETSVPIYDAYNHHYCAWLVGEGAELKKMKANDDRTRYINHGAMESWVAVTKDEIEKGSGSVPDSFKTTPSSQWFSEGNGMYYDTFPF